MKNASPNAWRGGRKNVKHVAAISLVLVLALASPLPAAAQALPAPSTHDRAIAAGYKALMLCGAILNARAFGAERSRDSVEALELTGIYPEYDAILPALDAEIGYDRVSVPYDATMPPRIADHRIGRGCTIRPIGATAPASPDHRVPEPQPAGARDLFAAPAPRASGRIAASVDRAFTGGFGQNSRTTSVLVLRDGQPVAERYATGFGPRTPQRTWSVAKSMAGTIIGAAVYRNRVDPDAPATVPEWQKTADPRAAITLDQLLRMASGLYSATAGNRTDALYFGGTAVTEETVAWPMEAPPGTRFRYANNDTLLAIRALRHVLGEDDFAEPLLFGRLGMTNTVAEQDWHGNYMLSSQVWSTARDFARLGQFWLDDGVWQGTRLLPLGWMRRMTTPSGPQPPSGPGYGATLWLFGPAQGLPEGSYAAQGNRGQYIMVVPARRLVVVRRGEDPVGARFDIAAFTADVLKALD
jgi:CubicO group peptidase (beta-lactamase class C family)